MLNLCIVVLFGLIAAGNVKAQASGICNDLRRSVSSYDVVIIGGGTAGMAAAAKLYAVGIRNITVLEARNRLGGRIQTITEAGNFLDMGAQYIHGEEGNVVYEFAEGNNLLVDESNIERTEEEYFLENGQEINDEDLGLAWDLISNFTDAVEKENNTQASVANIPNLGDGTKRAWDLFIKDKNTDFGDDIMLEHVDALSLYEDSEGSQYSVPSKGYMAILNKLVEGLPNETFSLNSAVKTVYWKIDCGANSQFTGKSALRLSDDRLIVSRYAILTIPLGVLKTRSVTFEPALPDKKTMAISRIGFGCMTKVFIRWQNAWWSNTISMLAVAINSEIRNHEGIKFTESLYTNQDNKNWYRYVGGFNSVYGQENMLEGWFTGRWASFVETLPTNEIQSVLVQVMRTFFRQKYPNIPEPVNTFRTEWCKDDRTKGSFPGLIMGSHYEDLLELALPLPNEEAPTLLFAGDATHLTQWSTVNGAWQTGEREAERIQDLLEN